VRGLLRGLCNRLGFNSDDVVGFGQGQSASKFPDFNHRSGLIKSNIGQVPLSMSNGEVCSDFNHTGYNTGV